MAKMIRAVDGTVPAGIHMITFVAGEETFVPDVPAVLEACRVAGAALVEETTEETAEVTTTTGTKTGSKKATTQAAE